MQGSALFVFWGFVETDRYDRLLVFIASSKAWPYGLAVPLAAEAASLIQEKKLWEVSYKVREQWLCH